MTKIMLVEDDNNLREIYEARLAAEGYEIVSAQDGEAALAIAAKERPDMIISDVMMPKISGFEMLDILRNTEALRNVKIIMLTALGQAEDSSRASSLGADRYLVKSQVTLEDIVKATHELLDGPDVAVPAAAMPPVEEVPTETPAETVDVPAPAVEIPAPEETPVALAPPPAPEADPVRPEPEPEPMPEPVQPPAPSVAPAVPSAPRSIPVQDFSSDSSDPSDSSASPSAGSMPADLVQMPIADDAASQAISQSTSQATTPSSQDSPTELHPISNLPVQPEPSVDMSAAQSGTSSDIPVVPPPASEMEKADDPARTPEDNTESSEPRPDFTSPDSFNNFQAPPSMPSATPAPSPELDLQTSADEESVMKAQIDDFINTAETDQEVAAPTTPAAPREPAGPAESAEPAEADSVISLPEPSSSLDEPVAEELAPVAPPVILAPEDTTASEESVSSDDDKLIASAADDLAGDTVNADNDGPGNATAPETAEAVSAEDAPSRPTSGSGMRTVAPLPSDPQPSIHQLLELEEAKNSATQAASQQTSDSSGPQPNIRAYNPSADMDGPSRRPGDNGSDPDSISL